MSLNDNARLWKAFKITLMAVPIEIALVLLGSSLPNNSGLQKFLLNVVVVPLLPAGWIMDQVFRGPSHGAEGLVILMVLSFAIFMACVFLILSAAEALNYRRSRHRREI